jgi:plastocyanin
MSARAVVTAMLLGACLQATAGTLVAHVVGKDGMPVEDAAVVLEPLAGGAGVRPDKAEIAQQDREYMPYLTIVPRGTVVEFPNRDPFKHHVYSFSPAKMFEIKLYAGKAAQPVVFDQTGEVALGCNVHDWMEAYVLVVNSNHYAKSGADGHAMIGAVPPGRYSLRLWHPRQRAEAPAQDIEIGADTRALQLVLDVAPRVARPKPPPDAEDY